MASMQPPQTTDLFLILKGEWYRMIEQGIKLEEYRNITEYWERRISNREYKTVTFQLGYSLKNRMTFEAASIRKGMGNSKWGATPFKRYFVITLGRRIK